MKRSKLEGVRQGTFEVRKGGAARFELKDPYHLAVALPWPAFVAGAIASLLLINLGFAALYALVPGALRGAEPGDVVHAFFFSLETFSTVGYGEIAPLSLYGYCVASIEMIVGMGAVALLTSHDSGRCSDKHDAPFRPGGELNVRDGTVAAANRPFSFRPA